MIAMNKVYTSDFHIIEHRNVHVQRVSEHFRWEGSDEDLSPILKVAGAAALIEGWEGWRGGSCKREPETRR